MLVLLSLGLMVAPSKAAPEEAAMAPLPCLRWWFRDFDRDTYGTRLLKTRRCVRPPGYSARAGDCNEMDASVNPGATEIYYDGIDSNCDGASDYDADGDGWDSAAWSGYDCDDTDAAEVPGIDLGECATEFVLQDQSSAWDALWNYYGDVILIDLSAGW